MIELDPILLWAIVISLLGATFAGGGAWVTLQQVKSNQIELKTDLKEHSVHEARNWATHEKKHDDRAIANDKRLAAIEGDVARLQGSNN